MTTTILTIISLLFLAAHALRVGSPGGVLFWFIAGVLALSPAPWKSWALTGLLGFGTWLWGDVALDLAQQRMALSQPWLRLVAILGTVTLFCLLGCLMNCYKARRHAEPANVVQASAFLLSTAGLALARQNTSLDILLLDRFFPGGGWTAVILLGFYSAWIAGKLLQPSRSAKWRQIIWITFSAVFFFQLALGLFGFERFLMTGDLHLPIPALIAAGPLYRGEGFFMIILFSVTLILAGPAWCSHLCYFGAWDNLAAVRKKSVGTLPGWTKYGRLLIAAAVMAVALILGRSGLPVSQAIILAAVFGIGGVAVILIWSRRNGVMTHCVTFCPMGLIADIFGKINPWRIGIGSECSRCGHCSRFCRYGALNTPDIKLRRAGLTCSLCGDCISGCPQGHLHYRFPGLSKETARSAFIVVIVALHTIFLGVARL